MNVHDLETQDRRKPFLGWPKGGHEEEDAGDRHLPNDAKERRERKCVSQAKVPWLRECLQSLRFWCVTPREEAKNERRCRKKVDVQESLATNHLVKDLGRKRPIRQRLKSRCSFSEMILLR